MTSPSPSVPLDDFTCSPQSPELPSQPPRLRHLGAIQVGDFKLPAIVRSFYGTHASPCFDQGLSRRVPISDDASPIQALIPSDSPDGGANTTKLERLSLCSADPPYRHHLLPALPSNLLSYSATAAYPRLIFRPPPASVPTSQRPAASCSGLKQSCPAFTCMAQQAPFPLHC